jgi:hypothetical protein
VNTFNSMQRCVVVCFLCVYVDLKSLFCFKMYLREASGYSENCPERCLGLDTCTDCRRAKAKKSKSHLEPVLEEKERREKKNLCAPIDDNFAAASMPSRTSTLNKAPTSQTLEALQEGSVKNQRPKKSNRIPSFFPHN